MSLNKILTTLNQPLSVVLDPFAPVVNTLSGVPVGTGDNSSTGELGVKVIIVGSSSLTASSTLKATSSPPTYTNNTNNPLSGDLAGNLRTADGGPAWVSSWKHTTSADASGGVEITDAPTSGKKLVLTDFLLSVDTDMVVSIAEEGVQEIMKLYMSANSTVPLCWRSKFKMSTVDTKILLSTSVSGNIAVTTHFYSE